MFAKLRIAWDVQDFTGGKKGQEEIPEDRVDCNRNPDICEKLSSCCGFSGRKKPVSKCPLANVVCRELSGLYSVEMTVSFMTGCEFVFSCCLFSSTLCIPRLCHGNCYMTIRCGPVKGMKSLVNFLEPEVSRIAICNLRTGGLLQKQGGLCRGKRCGSGLLQEACRFYRKSDKCMTLRRRYQGPSVSM